MVKFAPIQRDIAPRPAKKRYTNRSRTWGLTPFDDLGRCDGANAAEQRIYDVNHFLRCVLGEEDNTKDVNEREFITAREFILNSPARQEIEWRCEQIFADILGLTNRSVPKQRMRTSHKNEYTV